MKPLFVTGIDTGIGKTVISAILVEKLEADYWKPIQSGDLDASDTMTVQSLVSNTRSRFHPETYRLNRPVSPHRAAADDKVVIDLNDFRLPETSHPLIIEGAGGVMVPLNRQHLMIDLIATLGAEVIVVSKNYLGSINHTLLTLQALKTKKISVKGLIFNGAPDSDTEDIIQSFSRETPYLGSVPQLAGPDKAAIRGAAAGITIPGTE